MSIPDIVPVECALPHSPLAGERSGIDACVHCGFCLQACPTYVTLEDENDSPRGRIVLMRALLEGTLHPRDASVERHIAQCLGCRACETACPSGVPYGHLLEATRATLAEHRPIPFVARAILAVFERPRLLGAAMALGRAARAVRMSWLLARLPGRVGFAMAMLESTRRAPQVERAEQGSRTEGAVAARGDVRPGQSAALLTGCVMEGLFADTNRATERVLRANGYAPVPAPGQVCCGALHVHAGDAEAARRLARANIAVFEQANADYIVVNAAGCGAMMKDYGHLLSADQEWSARAAAIAAKVRDVSELLVAAGTSSAAPGGEVRARVAYDAPCHLLHAQRIANPPLQLLRAVPGIELVPLVESEMCCGSAGIYNLIEPETSDAVLDRKLDNIAAARPDLVATGNPGCLMQIGAGLLRHGSSARAVHPIDLLDASYRAQ
ncbi:MAG: (Fe-S)-binding protein [Gemmatimonadales bacterium]